MLNDQDMVLLHHEVEVDFPDGQPAEKHVATLLEFGNSKNGKSTTAMALTVGIPAAIGALVFSIVNFIFLPYHLSNSVIYLHDISFATAFT